MFQDWLLALTKQDVLAREFDAKKVLDGCLFYPASGIDGSPIRHWGIGVDSFVYVDMTVTKADFNRVIAGGAFKGYDLYASRELPPQELMTRNWRMRAPSSIDKAEYVERMQRAMNDKTGPFATWSVFERKDEFSDSHGPKRFSLLYMRAEGVAAYDGLFAGHLVLPKVVALIRPGTGFGGNFGNFEEVLYEVMTWHPHGMPAQILAWHSRGQDPFETELTRAYPNLLLGPMGKDGERDFLISLFGR